MHNTISPDSIRRVNHVATSRCADSLFNSSGYAARRGNGGDERVLGSFTPETVEKVHERKELFLANMVNLTLGLASTGTSFATLPLSVHVHGKEILDFIFYDPRMLEFSLPFLLIFMAGCLDKFDAFISLRAGLHTGRRIPVLSFRIQATVFLG